MRNTANKSRMIPSINSRGAIEFRGSHTTNKRDELIKYVDTCIRLGINPNNAKLYKVFTLANKIRNYNWKIIQ